MTPATLINGYSRDADKYAALLFYARIRVKDRKVLIRTAFDQDFIAEPMVIHSGHPVRSRNSATTILIPCVSWQDPTIDTTKELLGNDARKVLIPSLSLLDDCCCCVSFNDSRKDFLAVFWCNFSSSFYLFFLVDLRQLRPFSDKTLSDHLYVFSFLSFFSCLPIFSSFSRIRDIRDRFHV